MSTHQLSASAELVNDKVQFTGMARENAAITFDYLAPLGDGEGYLPLEMLLMSLAVCSGTAIVALLRKAQKSIVAFTVEALGTRRDTHPTSFTAITLHYHLTAANISEDEFTRAIGLSESTICPIWAMLRESVQLSSTHQLISPEE